MQQIRRYIRRPEVRNKTGLSDTTIYNLEKSGQFPLHFMLTPRCAAWDEIEVDAWLESRRVLPARAAPAPDVRLRKAVGDRKGVVKEGAA